MQRFLALPFAEKRLLLQAAVVLAHVRWVVARQGVARFHRALAQSDDGVVFDPAQRHRARQAARVVRAARHLVPGHCTCLHLALAVQQLLESRQIAARVRIGVRKDDGEFRAHAWVQAGGEVLLGGEDCDTYCALPLPAAWPAPGIRL